MDTYLDRLEIHGFKSFPDKTVIKLHKGITAVVGPNGCGKSNIVDSILWVLGEQRIKSLRGENNEDLIFNGSSSKKPLGMTEVGAFFASQAEDIYIARRFFRTGEGKYILNERYCRNKDIQDILFKLRLGGRNYFIFEQGSIEKLVSLKPSEKRMLIEEAAGISQYLIRKKETANKLIIAQQNLDNIQILILDKESRLKDLKNQVNFVQRYRRIKTGKVNHLKTLLSKKKNAFQGDFAASKSEIEQLINQESVLVKDISDLEKRSMKLEEQRWLIDKDLKQNQQNVFDYNKKVLSCKNEMERSRQGRSFKNQKAGDLKRTIENNKKEIANIDKQSQDTSANTKNLELKLNKENSDYESLAYRLEELNERLENTHGDNSGLKTEIFNVQGEMTRIGNQIKDIDKRMMRIENEVASKKNFVNQLHEQVSTGEINETETGIQTLTAQYEEKEKHFQEIEVLYEENKQKLEQLTSDSKSCRNEIGNLENQKKKYLEIKKKIAGEAGKDPGFEHLGFLQDLIQAEKEHRKLLENFYYEEMDALLLAQNHDFFKGDLNKCLLHRDAPNTADIPAEAAKKIGQEPGFTAWVKDLYTLKGNIHKDFFKNGALVDNLKNGINLFVNHGIDVVTAEGETVTREGLLIRNREKGILDVIDEIREIDNQKAQLVQELESVNKQLDEEKSKQPELTKKIHECRNQLRNMEKESMRLKSRLETLKKNRETNMKRVKFTESEIEMLEIEKDKLQDEFEALDMKNGELEDTFKGLSQRREQYREEVQFIKEEINSVEKEYLQKENAINLIKEKMGSSAAYIKNLKKTKARLETSITDSEREILKLNEDIEASRGKESELAEEAARMDKLKDQLEETVKSQEKEFSEINAEIKEKNIQLDRHRKALAELKEKKSQIEISLSSTKKDLFQLEDLSFKELNTELKNLEPDPELLDLPLGELELKIESYDEKLIKMRDSNRLNFSAESEYDLLDKDYQFLQSQKDDVVKSIEDMNAAIDKIDEESRISFLEAYEVIRENFKTNFQVLFEGGEAELSLMDDSDVLETGLEIKAQPPGKRLLSLNLLSGGEKTLTSLSFLFALFQYKPSPFCVFDEVDASLDEANIQRFLKFLHKLKENTQFLIITHNFKTMEEADYVYGITMKEPGISTIYSMKVTGKNQLENV
jgi:chromosome segregation protein